MHQLRAGCWGSTAVHSQLLWPIVWSREENFLRQWEALHRLGNSRHASQGERISPITVVHDASYMEEHGICLEEAQISQAGEVGFGWVVFPSEPISMCTLDHDLQLINFFAKPQPAGFGQNSSLSASSFCSPMRLLASGCMDGSVDPNIRSPMVRVTCCLLGRITR